MCAGLSRPTVASSIAKINYYRKKKEKRKKRVGYNYKVYLHELTGCNAERREFKRARAASQLLWVVLVGTRVWVRAGTLRGTDSRKDEQNAAVIMIDY